MIKATNITKKFGQIEVLRGVDVHVRKSEVVSIIGASGAGKSTLLHILGTLMPTDGGSFSIDGVDAHILKGKKLDKFRNSKIGFVFQFHQLMPEFTAAENAAIPAMIAGLSKKEALAKAAIILEQLSLGHRLQHKPSELSGGEQQRVAVARALINDPAVVFADEPTGNLDTKNATELHDLFLDLRDKTGQTFLIVTHNESLASKSDRTLHIKDGMIVG